VKTGKPLEKHYNLKVFLEDSKVFVLWNLFASWDAQKNI
jgi:hypothetical protein